MNKIQRARHQMGLTQVQVARKARLNQWDVSDLETGRYKRSDVVRNKVLKVLGLATVKS